MGDHKSHWQLQGSHITHVGGPYYKVPTFHISYGGTIRVIDSYKVPSFKSHCTCEAAHYKVPTFHIRYGGTISHWQKSHCTCGGILLQGSHMPYKVWGTLSIIDSYRIPALDSNHEDTSQWQLQGSRSGVSLPRGLGALIHLVQIEMRGNITDSHYIGFTACLQALLTMKLHTSFKK